ncbi:MAG: hypothetical protein ACFFBP_02245 [Promethearchaeota archaeon]
MPICYLCGEEFHQLSHCHECGHDYCNLHIDKDIHGCQLMKEEHTHQPYATPQPTYTNVMESRPQISNFQPSPQQIVQTTGPIRGTTDGTYTWYRSEMSIPENAFSPDSGIDFSGILFPYKSEISHFLIGIAVIYIIGLITFYKRDLITRNLGWAIFMLAGFYTTAFLFHELGHRQVGTHFKFPTKFRLLTIGMVLTIISITMGLSFLLLDLGIPAPTFALPGAVVVLGLDKISKETGLCKAAGPTVNLVYGSILLFISLILPNWLYPLNYLIAAAASINYMLGLFNMIPIGILDGQNIFKWNKKVYFALASSLAALLVLTYIFIYVPNLVLIIWQL